MLPTNHHPMQFYAAQRTTMLLASSVVALHSHPNTINLNGPTLEDILRYSMSTHTSWLLTTVQKEQRTGISPLRYQQLPELRQVAAPHEVYRFSLQECACSSSSMG